MEKRRIPRLSKKPRNWSRIDPDSLTAALFHQELTNANQVEPASDAGQVEPAGQVEAPSLAEAPGQRAKKAS